MTASRSLRFGLIGLGYFGKNHLRLLQTTKGIELAAVAARTQESLSKYPIPKPTAKTTDASSIIENAEIDCVVIATPPATHLQLAKKALENGKHVLLEKPMTPSLEEAKKLRDAIKKSKKTFMVGHQYAYNDYIRWLHDNIASLGKISHAIAEHLYLGPIRTDIGCLWDAGTHQLSAIQYLLNPGKLVEATGMSIEMSKKGIDDFTTATIRFESGLAATLLVSWFAPQKTRTLTLIGDKKMAVFDDVEPEQKLKVYSQPYPSSSEIKNSIPSAEIPAVAAKEPLRNEIEQFIRCIRTGAEPVTGISSSYQITEWLDRIAKSVRK